MRTIALRVSDELAELLDKQQAKSGTKPSEVARRALGQWAVSGYVPPALIDLKPVPAKRGHKKLETK